MSEQSGLVCELNPPFEAVDWQGGTAFSQRGAGGMASVGFHLTGTGGTGWTWNVDAASSDPGLMTGGVRLGAAGEILLVYTYAQSRRDRSPQAHALHALDPAGSLRWSLPWEITGQYALTANGLLVIGYASSAYEPLNQPPLEAHWLLPESGLTCMRQRIRIPEALWDYYRRAPRRWIIPRLEYHSGTYIVQVRAGEEFAAYLHAAPLPPGGADFSQKLAPRSQEDEGA